MDLKSGAIPFIHKISAIQRKRGKREVKKRDKYGYPVEIHEGRYIHNFLRYLFVGNLKQTLKRGKEK